MYEIEMEIVDEKKIPQWKSLVKKLHKSELKTNKKPNSEEVSSKEEKKISENETELADTQNIENQQSEHEKSNETELADTQNIENQQSEHEKSNEALENNIPGIKIERYISIIKNLHQKDISIIKNLHQKEIGDFSRLESISNYLTDGKQLLFEDEQYLKEKYEHFKEKTGSTEEFEYEKNSVPNKDPAEPQTILIDDIESNPTNNFSSLGVTISNIIKDSTPHFTVGIYGEWGTGKTTLMNAVEKNLNTGGVLKNEQKIVSVWYNAWQYDREENLATISLMKTVAYELSGHEKFDPISKIILKGLTILGKNITQNLIQELISQKGFDDEDVLEEKINQLNELYRESIYFDGLKKIKQKMEQIRKTAGKDYRVVIFIDDLDRCSPSKALETLESIKLFLGMEGFIFVVGLSHKTVIKLITQAYKATGVKGEDYIKKIIQIPIKIPSWTEDNIIDLIENIIKKNLHVEYTNFLCQNSYMIARVVDYNPRQLKRFINNVIIAFETFTSQENSPKITFNEIFLVKILKAEWPDFYAELVRNKDFLEMVKWILTKPKELKKYFKYLNTYSEEEEADKKQQRYIMLNKLAERTQGRIDSRCVEIVSDFDYETWIFFGHIRDVLFGIKDWKLINTVTNVVEEFPYELPVGATTKKEKPSD